MAYQFTEKTEERFQKLLTQFPDKRSMILPALYLVQREKGFVSKEGMQYIADRLGDPIALSHVYGVATFYTMYNKKPVGKYHIQICANISCYVMGSDTVTKHICSKLGIEKGETTPDKKYTVDEVQCLGACGYGPMMQINETYYEFLDIDKINKIMDSLE